MSPRNRCTFLLPKRLQGESFPINGDPEIGDDESDVENKAEEVNDAQRPIEKRVGVEQRDQIVRGQKYESKMLQEK